MFFIEKRRNLNYIREMNRINVLKQHYEPRLDKDETYSVLDWESRDAQYARFRAMTKNLDLNGRTILDIGCGCGDLFGLLQKQQNGDGYAGVDILEGMIERAVKEYPDARFFCADIFDENFCADEQFGCPGFDVTFASGIFNLNAGNNEEFLKKAVPVLAELAGEAFVFNLLDPESPDRDDRYFYYSPDKALELAGKYASEINLVKGYLDNDYTLICLK